MDQRIIDLYDRFTHGQISRREFMDGLGRLAGSTAAATALLPVLTNNYAQAAIVAPEDERIETRRVSYPAPGGAISGYLVRLKGADAKRPAVIVIHENRGLNPHIEDVTRRIALEGFLAFAPDLLTLAGGTPTNEDEARDKIAKLKSEDTVAQLVACVTFLKAHPMSTGKVGAVGFCWGGGKVNELAAASPELDAGVAYYGMQIPADKVSAIKAPLLLHYAGLDERINAGMEAYRKALTDQGKTFEIFVYDGVNHAFNNDTNATRYDKAAADLAWGRTVTFLKKYAGEPPAG
ncbi:dienelactone hydrolase family protein [Flaviflagellibacter deserti]|uniref:Dienelactone hydrolase family protein n=1 Tax=Flaviflagellibacter deserti TaxID=2267266 RepID=A0ABV9YUZ7_9HYPH